MPVNKKALKEGEKALRIRAAANMLADDIEVANTVDTGIDNRAARHIANAVEKTGKPASKAASDSIKKTRDMAKSKDNPGRKLKDKVGKDSRDHVLGKFAKHDN